MNLEQLIAEARKAVLEGKLDLAKQYTDQAKALKEIDGLVPAAVADSPEFVTMKAKLADYDAKWAKLEAEPANNKAGHLTVTQDETDKKAAQPFASLGEQLKAIYNATLYPHAMDDRLKAQKAVLGMNEGQASDGGFLVQTDFSTEIFRLAHDTGVLANRARRIPIGPNANGLKFNTVDETSRATGSRFGGVRGYWLAEGGTKTASQIRFAQKTLELKKLAAVMYATDELLQDTTALGALMQEAASEELAFLVDDAILNGTGVGMPLGILNSSALLTIAKETGQAAGTVVYENILKMWGRFHARNRNSAAWFLNQDVEPILNQMSFPIGTGGIPVYLPPGGLSTAPNATLLGRPVIVTEFNATAGTVGDIVLADMSQYLLIDKGGVQGASSIHVQFLTDQTAFRWVYRVDGQPMWSSPLTPYKGSATTSPFVALATRA